MDAKELKPGDEVIYMNHGIVSKTIVLKVKQWELDSNGRKVGDGNCILLDDGDAVRTPNHLQVLMDAVANFPGAVPVEIHGSKKESVNRKMTKKEYLLDRIDKTTKCIERNEELHRMWKEQPESRERTYQLKKYRTMIKEAEHRIESYKEQIRAETV